MTPKEKAKDLVDKFDEFTIHHSWREKNDDAIQCSLIAVDEIINNSLEYMGCDLKDGEIIYWQEVKQYIELL